MEGFFGRSRRMKASKLMRKMKKTTERVEMSRNVGSTALMWSPKAPKGLRNWGHRTIEEQRSAPITMGSQVAGSKRGCFAVLSADAPIFMTDNADGMLHDLRHWLACH